MLVFLFLKPLGLGDRHIPTFRPLLYSLAVKELERDRYTNIDIDIDVDVEVGCC